jgi:hypothetical protein
VSARCRAKGLVAICWTTHLETATSEKKKPDAAHPNAKAVKSPKSKKPPKEPKSQMTSALDVAVRVVVEEGRLMTYQVHSRLVLTCPESSTPVNQGSWCASTL